MTSHPQLTRQDSLLMMQQNPTQASGAQACCWFPFAVACLVIAARDDSNGCEDTFFTVDLVTFLEAAGGVQIAMLLFGFCIICCVKAQDDPSKQMSLQQLGTGPSLCAFVFYFTWAIIGINSYVNQMSDECQSSPVGTMVFVWSLAMIIAMGLACCCIFCPLMVLCCVSSASSVSGASGASSASSGSSTKTKTKDKVPRNGHSFGV